MSSRSLLAAGWLLVVAIVALWPSWVDPSWRGTEARRVQIAREMRAPIPHPDIEPATDSLEAWCVPRLGGEPTLTKPPLAYWALATTAAVDWLSPKMRARLPALLAWWLLAFGAFRILARRFDSGVGIVGSVGILTLPVVLHHGAAAEIDPLFAALGGGSVLSLLDAVAFERAARRRRGLVLAGLLGGLALLTKGPPLLMLWAGPWLVCWRQRRGAIRPLVVWTGGVAAVVAAAYYVPLLVCWVDPADLGAVASRESVGRALGVRWQQWVDLPAHWMRMAAMTLPLGLWFAFEVRGQCSWRGDPGGAAWGRPASGTDAVDDRELLVRGCASVWLATLLVLMAFPSRPTRYVLPALPLAAVGLAPLATVWVRAGIELTVGIRWLVGCLGILGGVALVVGPWLPAPWSTPLSSVLSATASGGGPAWWALLALPASRGSGCGSGCCRLSPSPRRRFLVAMLLLPVIAAHTLGPTYQARKRHRSRLGESEVAWLAHQARALEIAPGELMTRGHVPAELLLAWPGALAGDEFMVRLPADQVAVGRRPGSRSASRCVVFAGLRGPGEVVVARQGPGVPGAAVRAVAQGWSLMVRVLVLRLSALGDVVQTTGAVAALVAARPDVEVHWCVQREFAPVLDHAPFVHRVIPHDRRGGWRAMRATAAALRAMRAECALDLQGNWKSAWLVRASRAVHRIGLVAAQRREPWSAILVPTRVRSRVDSRHPAVLATEVVRHFAPAVSSRLPRLVAMPGEVAAECDALRAVGVDPSRPFTVMIVGGDADARDWPHAMRVAETRRSPGPVVWLAGPQDVAARTDDSEGAVRLVHGPGELRRLVALGRVVADAGGRVIGPDRGPTHVLAAAGAVTVAMFGPQDPAATAPPTARVLRARARPECVPCRRRECAHPEGPVCMRFTVDDGEEWVGPPG